MARTPLFSMLQRAFRTARLSDRPDGPGLDELIDMRREGRVTRRQMLKGGAAGLAALGMSQYPLLARAALNADTKIVIVGGGIAGLSAAYTLKKSGVRAMVYEGAPRVGGRMFSARNRLGEGLVTELGGEFVDSGHEDILNYVKEFGLELMDVRSPEEATLLHDAYFFGGKHYSEKEVIEAFAPFTERIAADQETMPEEIGYKTPEAAAELDKLSIKEYLDKLDCKGWFRSLLDVAFVTEFGLDAEEQSALNFLSMLSCDTEKGTFDVFGDSDERYKIKGGNQSVPEELAKRLEGQIKTDHRLEAIMPDGEGYKLSFMTGKTPTALEIKADVIIVALPFTILRTLKIGVELPPIKKKVIQELGYGTNAKIIAGLKKRVWREQGYGGNIFSDEPFQLAWDNSRLQPSQAGGVTFFSGGKLGMECGQNDMQTQVKRLMPGLEKAYPGLKSQFNGKAGWFHWPTYKWTMGSYTCYKPGQWSGLGGAEIEPVGNLHFAGEHCSVDFQGYMNGGAETGRRAAEAVLEKMAVLTPA